MYLKKVFSSWITTLREFTLNENHSHIQQKVVSENENKEENK